MSFLRRRWVSVGPKRSGPGSRGARTSGRGVCTRAWWGTPRHKGPPEREGPPLAARRRTKPWPGVTMTLCCLVSSGRLSIGPPTGRVEGASSQTTNAPKLGDQLQRSSGKSTKTCVYPPLKTPRAQPSRSIGRCRKQYPSISRKLTLRGLHQISPAQQVCWKRRRLSCKIGSFASNVHLRS